jgi:hypothetical protein
MGVLWGADRSGGGASSPLAVVDDVASPVFVILIGSGGAGIRRDM